jgi:hypothetical protein
MSGVSGPPYYFWVNRYEPFFVGSMQTASSGKVALVRTLVGNQGRPMRVNFRMMTAAQLSTWSTTTGVFTMLTKQVIWSLNNPLTYENEIIRESDAGTSNGTNLD